jgi:hypothetical protein
MTDTAPIQPTAHPRAARSAIEDDAPVVVVMPTEPAQLDRDSGRLLLSVLLDLRGKRD